MHRVKFAALSILPLLIFLCLSDTAAGQTLTVSSGGSAVTSLTFNVPANVPHTSTQYQQILTVAPDSNHSPATVQFNLSTPGSWLWVDGFNTTSFLSSVTSANPTTFPVTVDTTNLTQGTSSITLSACFANTNNCAPVITVTLNVTSGTSGNLSANPTSISCTATTGATTASCSSNGVQITNSSNSLNYTMQASTQSGGNWLLVNGGLSTVGGENGTAVAVSINSTVLSSLTAATYTGTLTALDTNNATVSVSVTLTVSQGTTVTPSPTAFTFLYQTGQTDPASQALTISSNSSSQVCFSLTFSSSAPWLSTGTTTGGCASSGASVTIPLNVTPKESNLAPGNYTTGLIITPFGGSSLATIPINLVVSNNPLLQISATTLTFVAAFAGQSPASQSLQVTTTGSGSSVGFSDNSDSSWLAVTANQNVTPATLTVSINSSSLAVGNYTGHITVRPTNGDNYTETVTVTLTVSNASQLTVGPSTLLFSYETSKTPTGNQAVLVQSSTSQAATFSNPVVTQNTCGSASNWLVAQASGNTTPATILVGVNPSTGFPASGVCTGTIAITPSGASSAVNITVTLALSQNTPLMTIQQQQGFGVFTMSQGGSAPTPQTLFLNSTDTPVSFAANSNSDRGWLAITNSSGATPFSLSLNVLPGGLSAGTYGGSITVSSNNLPTSVPNVCTNCFQIPITLVVTPNVTVTASPATLTFTETAGGAAVGAQNVTLTSSGGTASYTASIVTLSTCPGSGTSNSIIGVSPTSGTANGTVQVGVASYATAGTYQCQVLINYLNAATTSSTINVTVTVTPAVTVTVSPQSLNYAFTVGGTAPTSQALTLTSTGGAVQFSVGTTTTSGGSSWLTVDTTSGTTAGSGTTFTKTVNVSVNPQGLTGSASPGTAYNGSVTITSPNSTFSAITVNVTITVTQPPNPQPTVVTSTASNVTATISPGELITIKGTLMGPVNGVLFGLNAQGGVNNTLAGVQVTFDGQPGTPIYVSAGQINVSVPWGISGRLQTNIVVIYNGNSSNPIPVRVSETEPELFTLNQTGSGPAAAVNQNGTINGPVGGVSNIATTPAPAGSVVTLYATGCGQTSPAGSDGTVAPFTQLLRVTSPVSVAFGQLSQPLFGTVQFIGAAPGLVTGICQINVQLPANIPSGAQPVSVTVNGVSSRGGATISVQ